MAIICPTVLASTEHSFKEQMERVASFAHRVQIDLMDGEFAPHKSVGLDQVWWPAGVKADIHLMYAEPLAVIEDITNLKPHLLITHAEASGNFFELAQVLKNHDIKVGLAILKQTSVADIRPVIDELDHVLIFSGDLGSFGGHADMELLSKVQDLKNLKPELEVGWDGGINEHNITGLAQAGVDVLNVGGAIQRADNPAEAYARLEAMVEQNTNG